MLIIMMNLNKLIQKLPIEIIILIISYTYNPQSKILLEDIENYHNTKQKVFEIYYYNYIIYLQSLEQEDKNWLINDVIRYTNENCPTMYGYTDKFYNIWYRNPALKTKNDINNHILCIEKKCVNTQINLFWGILNPIERNEMVVISIFPLIII
jgi:hypothetical protein